jgi:hypothetical protein
MCLLLRKIPISPREVKQDVAIPINSLTRRSQGFSTWGAHFKSSLQKQSDFQTDLKPLDLEDLPDGPPDAGNETVP